MSASSACRNWCRRRSCARAGMKVDQPAPIADPQELAEYDGIIFGTPTRFGNMTSQMRNFLDQTGPLWVGGALIGKVGSVFTSTSTGGGNETTIVSFHWTLLHHGMVVVGLPYSAPDLPDISEVKGGSPYGAGTIAAPDGSRMPSQKELNLASFQGHHVAKITKKLALASPQRPQRSLVEDLLDPRARSGIDALGQILGREHRRLGDLAALVVVALPPPMAHHEHGDVVAAKTGEIGKDAVQLGLAGERHAHLFLELPGERHQQRLAPFDPAAGKPPARTIAMAHQQHAALGVDHRTLRAERQPAPHAPDGAEQRCQQPVRPEPSEQATLWSCAFLRHDLSATSFSLRRSS